MPVRKRILSDTASGLKEGWDSAGNPSAPVNYTYTTKSWQCEDVYGNYGGNNPLLINKVTLDCSPCSGTLYWTGKDILHYRLNGIYPDYRKTSIGGNTLPLSSPSDAALLARMNISKPMVDLPLFLFELKDLPGMAKQVATFGKSLPEAIRLIRNAMAELRRRAGASDKTLQGAAQINLALGFGWAPLISDLADMLGLADAFERRKQQLQKLSEGKSVKKRIKIDENTQTITVGNDRIGTVAGVAEIYGTRTRTVRSRKWATSQWQANDLNNLPSLPSDWDVVKSMLGLEISHATLYAAIPWSFLIDYFTNIGDFLEAGRNSHTFHSHHFCVMEEHISTTTWTRGSHASDDKWVSGGSGREVVESKFRRPINGSPIPSLWPFLSANQVSNLASLAIARKSSWR